MVMAYRTLMCAQYPSFKQGSYSVAMGQQVVPNFCCFAHYIMVIPKGDQSAIAFPAVSTNDASRNYRLPYSFLQTLCRGIWHTHKPNPANPLTVFLGSNHYQTFPQGATPSFPRPYSPYIGLVNLDPSRKAIPTGSDHGTPQFMEPGPCREITAKSEQSLQTQSTGAGLLIGYKPDSAKPHTQRLVGILKDGSSRHRRLVATSTTNQQITFGWPSLCSLTPRTNETQRPTQSAEIVSAGLFRGKLFFELRECPGVILHN